MHMTTASTRGHWLGRESPPKLSRRLHASKLPCKELRESDRERRGSAAEKQKILQGQPFSSFRLAVLFEWQNSRLAARFETARQASWRVDTSTCGASEYSSGPIASRRPKTWAYSGWSARFAKHRAELVLTRMSLQLRRLHSISDRFSLSSATISSRHCTVATSASASAALTLASGFSSNNSAPAAAQST